MTRFFDGSSAQVDDALALCAALTPQLVDLERLRDKVHPRRPRAPSRRRTSMRCCWKSMSHVTRDAGGDQPSQPSHPGRCRSQRCPASYPSSTAAASRATAADLPRSSPSRATDTRYPQDSSSPVRRRHGRLLRPPRRVSGALIRPGMMSACHGGQPPFDFSAHPHIDSTAMFGATWNRCQCPSTPPERVPYFAYRVTSHTSHIPAKSLVVLWRRGHVLPWCRPDMDEPAKA